MTDFERGSNRHIGAIGVITKSQVLHIWVLGNVVGNLINLYHSHDVHEHVGEASKVTSVVGGDATHVKHRCLNQKNSFRF